MKSCGCTSTPCSWRGCCCGRWCGRQPRRGGGLRRLCAAQDAAGLVWPIVMILVDMQYVRNEHRMLLFESLHRIGYLQTDANTIITAAFAMGTLITSMQSKRAAAAAGRAAGSSCHVRSPPVRGVCDTHSDVPVTSRAALIIRSAQRCAQLRHWICHCRHHGRSYMTYNDIPFLYNVLCSTVISRMLAQTTA